PSEFLRTRRAFVTGHASALESARCDESRNSVACVIRKPDGGRSCRGRESEVRSVGNPGPAHSAGKSRQHDTAFFRTAAIVVRSPIGPVQCGLQHPVQGAAPRNARLLCSSTKLPEDYRSTRSVADEGRGTGRGTLTANR